MPSAPTDPPPSAVGVFRSASGRTELTVTPDGHLDIRVRVGQDLLGGNDLPRFSWAVERASQLMSARGVRAEVGAGRVVDELLAYAWSVIANAGEGDWSREHPEWKEAAERWRDQYHTYLSDHRIAEPSGETALLDRPWAAALREVPVAGRPTSTRPWLYEDVAPATASAAWDPAVAPDPVADMRAMAERVRSGDLPDRTAELAADTAAAVERAEASGQPQPEATRERWTFTRREGEELTVAEAVQQAVGGASMCWEHVRRAGVFDSDRALEVAEALTAFLEDVRARHANAVLCTVDPSGAVAELVEAIRLTVEYLGTETLPPVEGWSWYDALRKYAPHLAESFVEQRRRLAAADPEG